MIAAVEGTRIPSTREVHALSISAAGGGHLDLRQGNTRVFVEAATVDGLGAKIKPRADLDAVDVKAHAGFHGDALLALEIGVFDRVDRRGIGKKMRCSRNEWNIAQTLLRIPHGEIHPDNKEYRRLIKKWILEEDFEATLDGRL